VEPIFLIKTQDSQTDSIVRPAKQKVVGQKTLIARWQRISRKIKTPKPFKFICPFAQKEI
jgi:hypothetical protein